MRHTAEPLGLLGWVRNLRDGRVEMVACGPPDRLQGFLDQMHGKDVGRYIQDVEVNWTESTEYFHGFEIRPTV